MADTTPAALAIAQMLKFNCIKHNREHPTTGLVNARHSAAQETPVPTYVGMMSHAHTRKRELVDRLSHLCMSISYTRILELSAQMGNSACEQFHREQVVCSRKMRSNDITMSAVDNIDHNPSSTTAKVSFHGTAISLLQHPSFTGEGVDRSIAIVGGSGEASSKMVGRLPHYYTDVPPVTTNMKNISVPATRVVSLARDNFKKQIEEEYVWLEHTKRVIEDNTGTDENISWSAFHASRQPQLARTISPTALLPLFLDSAHTVAIIRHSMDVVKNAVVHVNPGQTPVVTLDQPLFALAKQIQRKWPEKYGEYKMVVMFGGLHIEMAALNTLGDCLRGSGWVQALLQAEIATPGTADSFLRAAHVTRTRRAHQITATTLHILQHRAYTITRHCMTDCDDAEDLPEFEDWCHRRAKDTPHFQYWATVLELEMLVLVYMRSLQHASLAMYLAALTELVPLHTMPGGSLFT